MSIEVKNITKSFGSFKALDNVSIEIGTGKLVALLGPSGSGKTTLLRIIAGLEFADSGSGSVLFHDKDVSEIKAGQRQIGFVFQHYSLFRHMTIFDNVAFGLTVRPRKLRPDKDEIRQRVTKLLKLVQLERVANLYPAQLSGGQRQRVALVRALAVEPKVLLLDEPFGALDAKVRKELRLWLRRLHDEIAITSVFVTHDQDEALEVADEIAILNSGKIEQKGTPQEVYDHPANAFVYNFLGNVNIFHGRLDNGKVQIGRQHSDDKNAVIAYVRPHDIEVSPVRTGDFNIAAQVSHINPAGPFVRMQLLRNDNKEYIEAQISRERYNQLRFQNHQAVYVKVSNPQIFTDYVI